MSFGFSPSDIVNLLNLVIRVSKGWKNACGDYTDITASLQTLAGHLARGKSYFDTAQSTGCDTKEGLEEWEQLLASCTKVVSNLDQIITKYKPVSSRRSNWQRLKLGNKNLGDLQRKLNQCTTDIAAFFSISAARGASRMEPQLERLMEDMPEIKAAILKLVECSVRDDASIMTHHDGDDSRVWRRLRRTLVKKGVTSQTIAEYEDKVSTYLESLTQDEESGPTNAGQNSTENQEAKPTVVVSDEAAAAERSEPQCSGFVLFRYKCTEFEKNPEGIEQVQSFKWPTEPNAMVSVGFYRHHYASDVALWCPNSYYFPGRCGIGYERVVATRPTQTTREHEYRILSKYLSDDKLPAGWIGWACAHCTNLISLPSEPSTSMTGDYGKHSTAFKRLSQEKLKLRANIPPGITLRGSKDSRHSMNVIGELECMDVADQVSSSHIAAPISRRNVSPASLQETTLSCRRCGSCLNKVHYLQVILLGIDLKFRNENMLNRFERLMNPENTTATEMVMNFVHEDGQTQAEKIVSVIESMNGQSEGLNDVARFSVALKKTLDTTIQKLQSTSHGYLFAPMIDRDDPKDH